MTHDTTERPAPPDANPRRWPAIVALVVAASLWSLNGPLIKLLNEGGAGVHPLTLACYRSLLGGLLFLPFAWRLRRSLRNVAPGWSVAGVITFTVMTAAFVTATTQTTAANAILLQYTAPLWVFLLAPLVLREKPHWREGIVLVIMLTGVGVIFAGEPAGEVRGLSLALFAGAGYGALTILLRKLRAVSPTVVTCVNTLGSGLILLPSVGLWASYVVTPRQAVLIVVLAVVQFTIPYLLFSWALQRVEAHRASLLTVLEALLNPLGAYCFVGEAPSAATFRGGPIILLGYAAWILVGWRGSPQPVRPAVSATREP
ncbi:MAG: DMT family transporter [Phycisphaerae bacterium]